MERKTTAASLGVKRVWPYLKLFSEEEFRTELPASGPSVALAFRSCVRTEVSKIQVYFPFSEKLCKCVQNSALC